jgi:pimeloyl-ACP methyl ester carboxylesterase
VLLLHGWPYDIHSYADVAPELAAAGYRVIVPYLRGYGTTRFRSDDAVRNGQQTVLAVDAIALLDALGVGEAIVVGFDWGARTANVMAALWPERCRAMVSVSGYLIGSQQAGQTPLAPEAERDWWYQYYFATERGRAGYKAYRRDFARLIWRSASPAWRFDDATFERSAAAFDNPDHVAVVTTTTGGGSGSRPANQNSTSLNSGSRPSRRSACQRSRSKATRTVRRTAIPPPTPRGSPASTRTGPSPAASATTCLKKHRPTSRTRSKRPTA